MEYAKLGQPDRIPDHEASVVEENPPKVVNVGDMIQAEIGGVLAFPKPVRVRAIQDGWVFVDGHESGLTMEQVELIEKAGAAAKSSTEPPRLPLPAVEETPVKGTRNTRFALTEGDVVITFPDRMSADSVEDLDGFWQVFIKKARREAAN